MSQPLAHTEYGPSSLQWAPLDCCFLIDTRSAALAALMSWSRGCCCADVPLTSSYFTSPLRLQSIYTGSCGKGKNLANHMIAAAQTMGGCGKSSCTIMLLSTQSRLCDTTPRGLTSRLTPLRYDYGLTDQCGQCFEVLCIDGKQRGTPSSVLGPWKARIFVTIHNFCAVVGLAAQRTRSLVPAWHVAIASNGLLRTKPVGVKCCYLLPALSHPLLSVLSPGMPGGWKTLRHRSNHRLMPVPPPERR